MIRCDECNGKGYLPEYSHVCGGRCFACNGKGKLGKRVRTKKDVTTGHGGGAHVDAFYAALNVEHIIAWMDQDWSTRSMTPLYSGHHG